MLEANESPLTVIEIELNLFVRNQLKPDSHFGSLRSRRKTQKTNPKDKGPRLQVFVIWVFLHDSSDPNNLV